ncbi:MAG: DUF4383 domain-containing protein [Actinomycetota bacterium]|nr:DUF4383 domain-containing protein [Actinomycetota bacterium]
MTRRLSTAGQLDLVHRVGAGLLGVGLAVFGVLGFVDRLEFFSTEGDPVLGLPSNGLLSTISIVTAVVLVLAAARGGRLASTVMIVVGVLFLISAFANLAVLETDYNLLAFRLPNVFFSIAAGLLLLLFGAYGRISAGLPEDNPYRVQRHGDEAAANDHEGPYTRTADEIAADQEMAAAERAAAQHVATPEQAERVADMARFRTHEDRRRAWMRHS